MSKITIVENYNELSMSVVDRLLSIIQSKEDATVCLAGGNSPIGFFKLFVERVKELSLSLEKVTFISLDEWVGFNGKTKGSCRHTLNEHLFHPLHIQEEKIIFFDGTIMPVEREKERVAREIELINGIDFVLLGVGMNGHIGFNEPNVSTEEYVHIVPLDPITIEVSGKKLKTNLTLTKGITLGMRAIISAKKIVTIASGEKKSAIMQKVIEGKVTGEIPASLLREHDQVEFILDKAASEKLSIN